MMQTYGFCRIYDAKVGPVDCDYAPPRLCDLCHLVQRCGSLVFFEND